MQVIDCLKSTKRSKFVKILFLSTLILLVHLFLGFAVSHSLNDCIGLLVGTAVVYFIIAYQLFLGKWIVDHAVPHLKFVTLLIQPIPNCTWRGVNLFASSFISLLLGAFFSWVFVDSWKEPTRVRVRSFFGAFVFLLIGFLISANPARIKWRPVIGGLILQVSIAFLVLRWPPSTQAFVWFSNKVVGFLEFTNNGTAFTYGFVANPPKICGLGMVFVYTSLQIIIYFGGIVAVLYYYGIIQAALSRVAFVMHHTIGTTCAESLNAAACIFLGQTEAALLIEPALATMTESEIHSVMTAGFACIAGSLFAAYISFGACPAYLLSATVMSAAASLAVSKLLFPEISNSVQSKEFKFAEIESNSVLECLTNGACHSCKFVFAIAANLVVYIALLALVNSLVDYAGDLVGIQGLTFNGIVWVPLKILSFYLENSGLFLFPVAYLIGASDSLDPQVEFDETMKVAELMGIKTVLNEFIAYKKLSEMITEKTLNGARAKMIATYALCGFSNISMIGGQIAILSAMCPQKKSIFAKQAVRALISGIITCFITTCVAGMIIASPLECPPVVGQDHCLSLAAVRHIFNTTNVQL